MIKTHQFLNELLTGVSVLIRKRMMPELADIVKDAAILMNQIRTRLPDAVEADLERLVKEFTAKVAAGDEVSLEELIAAARPPVKADPNETFTPLPDEVEEATLVVANPKTGKTPVAVQDYEADVELDVQEVESDEDFLAELDEELSDA
jgi:hypothetical protein